MKKILFLMLCIASFAFPAVAQNYQGQLTGPAPDTLTNAASQTYVLNVTGPKHAVTFQYNVAKISGTVAGTIKVNGTIDGVKYVTLNTYTITDATQVGGYSVSYNGYTKYQVIVATTGTQVSSYDIWALYRQ